MTRPPRVSSDAEEHPVQSCPMVKGADESEGVTASGGREQIEPR